MFVRLGVPVVAVLFLAGGWLLGEDPKKPADPKDPVPVPVKGMLPANWKKLGLTDTQTREVYRIRAAYAAKIDVLKRQIAELVGEEKVELDKVLTDAQKARLKELKLGEPTKPKDPGDSKDKPGEKPAETTAKKEKTEDKK
jgi:hypothetical protein